MDGLQSAERNGDSGVVVICATIRVRYVPDNVEFSNPVLALRPGRSDSSAITYAIASEAPSLDSISMVSTNVDACGMFLRLTSTFDYRYLCVGREGKGVHNDCVADSGIPSRGAGAVPCISA